MSQRCKHWRRIVKQFDHCIAECEQLILDTNYWNGLSHNQQFTPLDVEQDRVLLAKLRKARAEFIEKHPEPSQ